MSYHVARHDDELVITRNFRHLGVTLLCLAFMTFLASVITHAKADLTLLSHVLGLSTCLLIGIGLPMLFLVQRVRIDYTNDTVNLNFPLRKVIPFKQIDLLVIHKQPKTDWFPLGANKGERTQWVITLETDAGNVNLMTVYSELDAKRFLTEMQQGAEWPTEHRG